MNQHLVMPVQNYWVMMLMTGLTDECRFYIIVSLDVHCLKLVWLGLACLCIFSHARGVSPGIAMLVCRRIISATIRGVNTDNADCLAAQSCGVGWGSPQRESKVLD